MSNKNPALLWWEDIPGPRRILTEISKALVDAKSVVINSCLIPWEEKIRFKIFKELEELHINIFELNASLQGEKEPGFLILDEIGRSEDRNSFRHGMEGGLPKYLKDRKVLQNKLVYVSNIEKQKLGEWIDFITKYKQKNIQEGIFFLETENPYSEDPGRPLSPKVLNIDVRSRISFYDILSFAMLLASPLSVSDTFKQYIGWLASIVFENNIEGLADFFCHELQDLDLMEIIGNMENQVQNTKFFQRSQWRAQMHIFFPIVEQLDIYFIEQNMDFIKNALARNEVIYFQQHITDPYDVELDPLVFMISQNMLSVSGQEEAEILFLRDFRNNLAHSDPCECSRLERLIEIAQQKNIGTC
jgi:hypothetical protein